MSALTIKPATRQGVKPGDKYARLTVLKFFGIEKGHRVFECQCDCGAVIVRRGSALIAGGIKSCGCQRVDTNRKHLCTHGLTGSMTYRKWQSMKSRCRPHATGNPKDNYFLKGISVCEPWQQSFETFLTDMGECPPGMEIDRWPNQAGNYEPGNCRWATHEDNQLNKIKVLSLTVGDRTLRLKEWAEITGIAYQVIRYRFHQHWTPEQVVSPVHHTANYAI